MSVIPAVSVTLQTAKRVLLHETPPGSGGAENVRSSLKIGAVEIKQPSADPGIGRGTVPNGMGGIIHSSPSPMVIAVFASAGSETMLSAISPNKLRPDKGLIGTPPPE